MGVDETVLLNKSDLFQRDRLWTESNSLRMIREAKTSRFKPSRLLPVTEATKKPPAKRTKSIFQNFDYFEDKELTFFNWLAIRASPIDTSPNDIIERSTFMLISTLKVCACIAWFCMYYILDEKRAALMPFFYFILVCAKFTFCVVEGMYEIFVCLQLVLILVFPLLVHLALGGIYLSGGVMLWSFLSPLGAAFFRSSSESISWYKAYVVLTLAVMSMECTPSRANIPPVIAFYLTVNLLGVTSIVFAAAYYFAEELESEYNRSEKLLLNVLPKAIATRIKMGEQPIVDSYEEVSILFADIVGFTTASAKLPPDVIIEGFLLKFFQGVDKAVERHQLTKIKTIGDAYMAVLSMEMRTIPIPCCVLLLICLIF
jgi:adenylate cyclase